MLNKFKDAIHQIVTNQAGIYSCLYFSQNVEILRYEHFYFNFPTQDDVLEDAYFLLDNIIAKIIQHNFSIDYNQTRRLDLGNQIIFNNQSYKNHFITNQYQISDSNFKFIDLENYLDDFVLVQDLERYTIKWKLPIYKLPSTIKASV